MLAHDRFKADVDVKVDDVFSIIFHDPLILNILNDVQLCKECGLCTALRWKRRKQMRTCYYHALTAVRTVLFKCRAWLMQPRSIRRGRLSVDRLTCE